MKEFEKQVIDRQMKLKRELITDIENELIENFIGKKNEC
jgi:hypothetical protein